MSRVRLSVTDSSMSQVEALNAIKAATDRVFITPEDAARASGIGRVTIVEQIREDNLKGTCELGFHGIVAKSRVSVNREAFLWFVEHGHKEVKA